MILVPHRFLRSTAMACCSAHAHLVTRQRVLNAGVRPSSLSARMKKNRNPTVSNCRPPARPTTSAGRKQFAFIHLVLFNFKDVLSVFIRQPIVKR